MKHKHAGLMMMYAEDAMTTDKPWLLWECKDFAGDWVVFHEDLYFYSEVEYRRKPKTINIKPGGRGSAKSMAVSDYITFKEVWIRAYCASIKAGDEGLTPFNKADLAVVCFGKAFKEEEL